MSCTIEEAKEAAIRREERERVVRILVDKGYCTEKLGTPCRDNCFTCWEKFMNKTS
jgi:radical SAM superfamily enzyme